MTHAHARKPAARGIPRAAAGPEAEPEAIHDKRVVANLFATWHLSRCGREACARARTCIGPDAACFDENRQHLLDALDELAASPIFADPDAEDGEGG